jgi:nicotinate-nucleotide adenylyltransferase
VSKQERIGIFGGTFDPIHNAHCEIARAALEKAGLGRIIFVVSAHPPHKQGGPYASAEDRFSMVVAAVQPESRFEVSRVELDRNGPSYTGDTLEEMRRLHPGAGLFLIIGYDSLLDLPRWKDPEGIVARARLLVVPRPNASQPAPAELKGLYDILPFQETALSSTEVRERIIAGEPFEDLVPPPVARLIRERGIYRAHSSDRAR